LGVVNHWEQGRTQVPSELVPAISQALSVTICGLYGVEEGHQVPAGLTLSEQLAQALGVEPGRVEVNVYADVPDGRARELPQRSGARWFQRVMAEWATVDDSERRELAKAIKELDEP
jgi:hypothetical protein